MHYPLGNDENGVPLDVPPTAAGWLVRRHAGGEGRPGMVYGPDGRPLVVALDATGEDLRVASVGPGMYRLDAVDVDRKPVGVTAYTELVATDDGESPLASMTPASASEAALLTMSRQMELMLRQAMQAQRDLSESLRLAQRDNSENLRHVLTKLTDLTATRVGGASWKDFDDYEKRKEKVVETEIARRNGTVDEQELETVEEGESDLWWSPLVKVGRRSLPSSSTLG